MTRTKVFISYSHRDDAWRKRVALHLDVVARQGVIEVWDDRKLRAGTSWFEQIHEQMLQARIAVILVSSWFLTPRPRSTAPLRPSREGRDDHQPSAIEAVPLEGDTVVGPNAATPRRRPARRKLPWLQGGEVLVVGFNAARIRNWGGRQPGFERLASWTSDQIQTLLDQLNGQGKIHTFKSRSGRLLCKALR